MHESKIIYIITESLKLFVSLLFVNLLLTMN